MSQDYTDLGLNVYGYKDVIISDKEKSLLSPLDLDSMISSNTIGNIKLSSGAVSTSKIADSAVTEDQLADGAVTSSVVNLALRGWTFTSIFSASDYNTVAWTLGTFTASDGTSYSIVAGNTVNITALTYIYLDIAVSETVLQTTTTATTAVGNGKVLIAVAQNNSDTTSKATFQVFGGSGGNSVMVDNIVANSASTNEFVSNTAQIANAIITSAKISDLSADKLTAGTINASVITVSNINADNITSGTITGRTVRTASSGERVQLETNIIGNQDGLVFYDSGGFGSYFYITSGGDFELEGGDVLVESNLRVYDTVWSEGANFYLKDNNGHTIVWCDGSDDSINVGKFYLDGWELTMTAPKTAIVETTNGYKALYCTESPEIWFMDFCDSKNKIDPMFLEVTEGDIKFIKLDGQGYQVWRRRKGMADKRFEDKTKDEFMQNNQFWAGQSIKRKVREEEIELSNIEKKISKYKDEHIEEVLAKVEENKNKNKKLNEKRTK